MLFLNQIIRCKFSRLLISKLLNYELAKIGRKNSVNNRLTAKMYVFLEVLPLGHLKNITSALSL